MTALGLHAFCSVKGGVGKSTLAIATAKLLAGLGRVPVVVDADMLGTSLADGLRLRAPIVKTTPDGWLDLEATATGRWHSVEESRALRSKRGVLLESQVDDEDREGVPAPPFLNDALDYPVPDPSRECSVGALLWAHEKPDGVWYLPSSPLRVDAARAALHAVGVAGDFRWVRRLTWVIEGLLTQRADVTDVVLDLPAGTWGFAHEVMVLAGTLGRSELLPPGYPAWTSARRWRINPFIVTSRDRNDRLLAIDYLLDTLKTIPNLSPLCNRFGGDVRTLSEQVKQDLPPELRDLELETKLKFIPELGNSLGRTFVEGDFAIEERDVLLSALRLREDVDGEAGQ